MIDEKCAWFDCARVERGLTAKYLAHFGIRSQSNWLGCWFFSTEKLRFMRCRRSSKNERNATFSPHLFRDLFDIFQFRKALLFLFPNNSAYVTSDGEHPRTFLFRSNMKSYNIACDHVISRLYPYFQIGGLYGRYVISWINHVFPK